MYGQGNYAPQFVKASQRPVPPPHQQHGVSAPSPLPPVPALQPPQLIQQAAPQPPLSGQPGPSVQRLATFISLAMPQPVQPGLMPNPGQSYFHQLPVAQGSRPMMNAFLGSQQTPAYPCHIGTQNVHYAPPPAHPPVPPPPPPLGLSRAPPPPPSQPQQIFGNPVLPVAPPRPPQFTPPPPVPSTSGSMFRPLRVDWPSQTITGKSDTPSLPSQPPPPPPSTPPPLPASSPSPSVTYSSGPSNPADDSGDKEADGSASGYPPPAYEATDEKTIENTSSIKRGEETYFSGDSDIDMEDDITTFDKEQLDINAAEEQKQDWFSPGNGFETLGKDNALLDSRGDQVEAKLSGVGEPRGNVTKSEKSPDQMLTNSPFRMIQDYASEDSLEEEEEDNLLSRSFDGTAASSRNKAVTTLVGVLDGSLKCGTSPETNLGHSKHNQRCESSDLDYEAKHVAAAVSLSRKLDEHGSENSKEPEALSARSFDSFQQTTTLDSANFDVVYDSDKDPKDNRKSTSVRVDEFGRLVREGISESESDDMDRKRSRRRRGRSRSSSQSPQYRRRRRTPMKIKERRSRSRSWSPRKRRSRSRSPFRRASGFAIDHQRRGRAQMHECFNFLKGKCYRGSSCRYLHHELDKGDGSRHARSRQRYSEFPQSSRNSESNKEYKDMMVRPSIGNHDSRAGNILPDDERFLHEPYTAVAGEVRKTDLVKNSTERSGQGQDHKSNNKVLSSEPLVQDVPGDPAPPLRENVEHQKTSVVSFGDVAVHNALLDLSAQEHHVVDHEHPQIDCTISSNLGALQFSLGAPRELPIGELHSCQIPHVAKNQENLLASGSSSMELEHHFSHLPTPAPLQPTHGMDLSQDRPIHGVHSSIASGANEFPMQPSPAEVSGPHQSHLSRKQFHALASNKPWSTRAPSDMDSSISGVSMQFQMGNPPVGNELVRPITSELPGHTRINDLQHTYVSIQDPLQPPSSHVEESHDKLLLASSGLTQQLGGPSLLSDDSYTHLPPRGIVSSSLFPPGNTMFQSTTSLRDTTPGKLQPLASDNRPADVLLKYSFGEHLHYQKQHPLHELQESAPDKISSHLSGPLTTSKYPVDLLDRNQQSSTSDIGRSSITAHYNPYASTFNRPLNLNFSSRSFRLEGGSYGAPYASVPVSVEGKGVQGFAQNHIACWTNSSLSSQAFPKSGGDQYDPFEPDSEPSKKKVPFEDHGADNSDIMLKLSGYLKPLNMEESNEGKEVGDAAATKSLENDEFDETRDAEAGTVANGSTRDPIDDADASAGEIEIDQVESKDKSTESKDSRSMKLFKAELANFVKEVLKPSWRQGNMSKEAFKTIVKKTVDKVSAAMKSHRMPKSKEKINQYIDSSHRKLTQLVEGYVNKYAKA